MNRTDKQRMAAETIQRYRVSETIRKADVLSRLAKPDDLYDENGVICLGHWGIIAVFASKPDLEKTMGAEAIPVSEEEQMLSLCAKIQEETSEVSFSDAKKEYLAATRVFQKRAREQEESHKLVHRLKAARRSVKLQNDWLGRENALRARRAESSTRMLEDYEKAAKENAAKQKELIRQLTELGEEKSRNEKKISECGFSSKEYSEQLDQYKEAVRFRDHLFHRDYVREIEQRRKELKEAMAEQERIRLELEAEQQKLNQQEADQKQEQKALQHEQENLTQEMNQAQAALESAKSDLASGTFMLQQSNVQTDSMDLKIGRAQKKAEAAEKARKQAEQDQYEKAVKLLHAWRAESKVLKYQFCGMLATAEMTESLFFASEMLCASGTAALKWLREMDPQAKYGILCTSDFRDPEECFRKIIQL